MIEEAPEQALRGETHSGCTLAVRAANRTLSIDRVTAVRSLLIIASLRGAEEDVQALLELISEEQDEPGTVSG